MAQQCLHYQLCLLYPLTSYLLQTLQLDLHLEMKRCKELVEEYDQIMQSSENQEELLAKILAFMFSDQYIFTQKPFRKLLQANPQGYIHTDTLLQCYLLDTFFKQNKITAKTQKVSYLRSAVEQRCPQLYYHLARIRRLNPFDLQRFNSVKPICLQRISQNISISDLRNYFNQHVFLYNRKSLISKEEGDVLVYSLHYRENLQEIVKKQPPFEILNFEAYYKQYDLSFRLRERKHQSLCKPIEVPRRKMHDKTRRQSSNKMDEDFKEHKDYKKTDYHSLERTNLQNFITYGRTPNLTFNTLLKAIANKQIEIQN